MPHHRHRHRHRSTPAEIRLTENRVFARYGAQRHALLADTQPAAPNDQYTLPLTLTIRPMWRSYIGMSLLALSFGLCSGAVGLPFHWPTNGYLGNFVILTAFSLLCLQLLNAAVYSRWIVTEAGIEKRGVLGRAFLAWNDITLFAIEPPPSFSLPSAYDYSVSTENVLLKIDRPLPHPQWYYFGELPTIPYAEYMRQLDFVLSVIAERTKLSLADLRKEYPKLVDLRENTEQR